MTRQEILDSATSRFIYAVPQATDIAFFPHPESRLDLKFSYEGAEHRFWLDRKDGSWVLSEHRVNGTPQPQPLTSPSSRFETLVSSVLKSASPRPKIRVVELRCPEDSRRLFAKLIVQTSSSAPLFRNLLEISCSICKRTNKQLTMHLFSSTDGSFVRTEFVGPWVKRNKPSPWYRPVDAVSG